MVHDRRFEETDRAKRGITKQLEAKLYKLYNTLKEKRKGVGVVSATGDLPRMFCECSAQCLLRFKE